MNSPAPPHPRRREGGFTLGEVLLALTLIAAVLLPLSGVYASGMTLWCGMQQRAVASRALYNTAAVLQAVPFDHLLPGTHQLPGPDLPQGQTTVTIAVEPNLALIQAAVRVTWLSSTGPQVLERQVLRSPFGPYPSEGETGSDGEEAS